VQAQAEKAVKKTQRKAAEAIKKVVAKQETAPGGLVDIITETIAEHAKANRDRYEDRARVQAAVSTKAAANAASMRTATTALAKGLSATRRQNAEAEEAYRKSIEDGMASPLRDTGLSAEEIHADLEAAAKAPAGKGRCSAKA